MPATRLLKLPRHSCRRFLRNSAMLQMLFDLGLNVCCPTKQYQLAVRKRGGSIKTIMNRKQRIPRVPSMVLIGWMFLIIAVSASAADGVSTEAGPEGIAQTAYAPPNGPGPIIMVLSGHTGPLRISPMRPNWPSLVTIRCFSPARTSSILRLPAPPI